MPQQLIDLGAAPNDGNGDTLRDGAQKINDNFTELYGLSQQTQDLVERVSPLANGFDSWLDLEAFTPESVPGDKTVVHIDDAGTHLANSGDIGLDGLPVGAGLQTPNAGRYENVDGVMVRQGNLESQSAQKEADALAARVADIDDLKERLPPPFAIIPVFHAKYSHAIAAENGFVLAYIERATGKWKISLADDAILPTGTALDLAATIQDVTDLKQRLGAPFSVLPLPEGKYSHVFVSENNMVLARVERATGKWLLGFSEDVEAPAAWAEALLGGVLFEQGGQFSGFLSVFRDAANNFLAGFKSNGRLKVALSDDSLIPEALITSAITSFLSAPAYQNNGVSGPAIACVGDSLTASAGSSGFAARYPSVLATMTGRVVTNLGVGGESARTIFGRVGAWPYRVTVSGGVIPASGPVVVTMTSLDGQSVSPLLQGSAGLNPCFLAGIEGTLSRDSGTGVYSFTRTAAGDAKTVKHPISLVTDAQKNRMGDIIVADVGQNGGFADDAQLMAMHAALFANQTSAVKRGLVIGRNTGTLASRAALHDAYQRAFGARFINLLAFVSSEAAFDIVGVSPSPDDLAAISAGSFPPSFWASPTDSVHGNDYFYYLKAYAVDERLRQLGWI